MVLYRILLISHLISLVVVTIAVVAPANEALPPSQALPGCPARCGNLTVPYPFGIGEGCFLREKFSLTCDESTKPPTLRRANFITTNISAVEGEMQILSFRAYDCYDKQGYQASNMSSSPRFWVSPPFTISSTRNRFVAVGYDTYAVFIGYRHYPNNRSRYVAGCMSISDSLDNTTTTADAAGNKELCSGIGCCTTSIPNGLKNRTIKLSSYDNHTYVWDFNPCSYAFIVEEGKFTFDPATSFQLLHDTERLPMILNWEIPDGPCAQAQKRPDYACKAKSECVNRTIDINTEPTGYYCKCKQGYEGNPYLPDGCRDINECIAPPNRCNNGTCENDDGGYHCTCKNGFTFSNQTVTLQGCIPNPATSKNKPLEVVLGVIIGFLILLVLVLCIYWKVNKMRLIKLKEKHFKDNGGLTLQQQLSAHGGGVETPKIYTAEELEKATNSYHADEILGEGGYGTVFKGILRDNKVVAIKKSKIGAPTESDQFANEVIVLSQINHRNVVKLLGCCFETEVPLLVYEYITHGTLFEHIFNKGNGSSSLSWELRLKIASETAGALAYLHSSASIPIIHRDVKTTNILLDDNYTAKVSDFGASRFIPLDQTQLATLVQGTLGYLDPEYFHSNQLTEKSDVYSFGVVLAELLTSRVALSFARPDKERCLASFFVSSIENGCLIQILDADIVNEGNIETVEQVAKLAKRCLMIKGDERPTMREVAMELEGMRITAKHTWKNGDSGFEETEYLLGSHNSEAAVGNIGGGGASGSIVTNTVYDSMQIQMLMPYDDGR